MILLHTVFSLALAISLLLALQSPVRDVVYQSEVRECELALELMAAAPERAMQVRVKGIDLSRGTPGELGLDDAMSQRARGSPGQTFMAETPGGWPRAVRWDEASGVYLQAAVRSPEARAAVERVYLLLTLALLAVYGLIAVIMEVLVLPRQVYRPIERMVLADEAVQAGRRSDELIGESEMPNDEVGDIMRSRNASILKLREQERALGEALDRVEQVANELKRKNHLLETVRRNLADQDRLASLGMMSAGIAHELNTPLAVLKGCVEEAAAKGGAVPKERLDLMLRVTRRLERLSESLLDFARARPPSLELVELAGVTDEAWTLVSLDRDARGITMLNELDASAVVRGDGDRLTQVLVNLLRNAVDAMDGRGTIEVTSGVQERDGRAWLSLMIADDGPGIDPAVLPRLFEPFASTRLDSHGTGLGLAVAEGIVREHGGVLLARNATPPRHGAIFEVMLPVAGAAEAGAPGAGDASPKRGAPGGAGAGGSAGVLPGAGSDTLIAGTGDGI